MSNRSATYVIMTLVAFIVICGIVSCHPARAGRGCLEREQAQRTWPTKQLGLDEDGCWTYLRRGVKPLSPPVIEVPPDMPVEGPARASAEIVTALDLMQRWPLVYAIEQARAEEPGPLVTPRNVATVILSVVLFVAVFEVALGGVLLRKLGKRGVKTELSEETPELQ